MTTEDTQSNQSPLQAGAQVDNYRIIKQLGDGGFCVTYLARDIARNTVVIKEYLPATIACRQSGQMEVNLIRSEDRAAYQQGLARFRKQALSRSQVSHSNLVKIQQYFEANGTAYLVMEDFSGQSLQDVILERDSGLNTHEIKQYVLPIFSAVAAIHRQGYLHLNISPANIVITAHNHPVLMGFDGNWGNTKTLRSQHTLAYPVVSGFSAPETYRYREKLPLSPATDLYALGKTLYHLMAPAQTLPDSLVRCNHSYQGLPDPLKPIREVATGFDDVLYQVVEACTALKQQDRVQNVSDINRILGGLYGLAID